MYFFTVVWEFTFTYLLFTARSYVGTTIYCTVRCHTALCTSTSHLKRFMYCRGIVSSCTNLATQHLYQTENDAWYAAMLSFACSCITYTCGAKGMGRLTPRAEQDWHHSHGSV
jgi:hypothetical protein